MMLPYSLYVQETLSACKTYPKILTSSDMAKGKLLGWSLHTDLKDSTAGNQNLSIWIYIYICRYIHTYITHTHTHTHTDWDRQYKTETKKTHIHTHRHTHIHT